MDSSAVLAHSPIAYRDGARIRRNRSFRDSACFLGVQLSYSTSMKIRELSDRPGSEVSPRSECLLPRSGFIASGCCNADRAKS